MAQGDVHIDGDGKVSLDATGKVRLHDAGSDCPECCGGCTASGVGTCSNCDDITPVQYDATISSHVMCRCVYYAGAVDVDIFLNFAINAKHTLTRTGFSSCTWRKTVANGATYRDHTSTDGTCTTVGAGPLNYDVKIDLRRVAGTWRLFVYIDLGSTVFYIYDSGLVASNTDGLTELCATVPSLPSTYVVSNCGTNPGGTTWIVGYNGAATVVCV